MPGVPSGRGCDACRKQKKKCDQGRPTCARCARLQIKCVGSGQRRFKFKEQVIVREAGSSSTAVSSSKLVAQSHKRPTLQDDFTIINIPYGPSNETTRLTEQFVSVLDVRDLRYSLATYGMFLFDTPRRMGVSKALDASVKALITCYPTLHNREQSLDSLSSWVRALNALRGALKDPKEATSMETLCAIYFVYICQTWLGQWRDDHSSHAEGMAYILNTMVAKDLRTEYEARVFITMSAAVIFESFLNDQLKVNPLVWEATSTYNVPSPVKVKGNGYPMQSLQLRYLVDYARLLRDPDPDYDQVSAFYTAMRLETLMFGHHIRATQDPTSPEFIASDEIRCHMHAGYALGLGISMMFNGVLRAHHPNEPGLLADVMEFINSSFLLAEHGLQFRPLGSSWMSICLIPAWSVAPDLATRAFIDQYIVQYEVDPFELGWRERAYWFQERLDALQWKVAARSESTSADDLSLDNVPGLQMADFPDAHNGCCVM